MAPDEDGKRRAAAGKAGAADFPEQAPVTGDAVVAIGANELLRRSGSAHVWRAGFAGRGTTFALLTGRHTLAVLTDPRQGIGSHYMDAKRVEFSNVLRQNGPRVAPAE